MKLQKLRMAFAQIRRQTEAAMDELDALELLLDPRHAMWRCDGCGYEKHFTKPSSVEACDSCPRCKGTSFSPVIK
jgi:hypothetical protein